ncbi:hypothetical protein WMC41_09790 [Shinella yambaruensis]|uniref:hypothetical protein n=1 Tax=Shinella yambaruensis TaxID=415996 RepID=UPI003D78C6AD
MPAVGEIADHIIGLRERISTQFNSQGWTEEGPLNQIQGYLPSYSILFVYDYINYTANRVRALSDHDVKKNNLEQFLSALVPAVSTLQFNHLANDADIVIGGLMNLLQMVNERLPSEAKAPVPLDWEDVEDKSLIPRDLARRLRALEATLARLEPRSIDVDRKIADIEAAHAAAEQLPEDLEELAAKRDEVKEIGEQAAKLLEQAQKLVASINNSKDDAVHAMDRISDAEIKADRLISRSEQALRGSTGVGLANAFEKRKTDLSWIGLAWVIGLIGALVAAFVIGADRVAALQTQLKNDSPAHLVWMNVVLTIFGVGGPIWFAWLSTKQSAVTLRLAEDYAFKAAVSKAYEGYRKEAVEIDPSLQARLFSSALDRLEEAPIRLMDKETHSSPLQELLSNPSIRKSLEGIPGITDKIFALIPTKDVTAVAAPVVAAAAIGSAAASSKSAKKPKEPEVDEQ